MISFLKKCSWKQLKQWNVCVHKIKLSILKNKTIQQFSSVTLKFCSLPEKLGRHTKFKRFLCRRNFRYFRWSGAKTRSCATVPQSSVSWGIELVCYCLFRTWKPSFQSTQSLQQCNVLVTEEAKWTKSRWSKVLTGEQPPLALQSGQEFFWKMY